MQVAGWQHAAVSEAQVKVSANLQYQIENAGLKSFRLLLPTNAEGVRFQGDQVGDFLPEPGAVTNGMQAWEVKLRRRVIGPYLLQACLSNAAARTGRRDHLARHPGGGREFATRLR